MSTKVLLEHPRLTVVEDDVVLPDGHETKYVRLEELRDFVTIIATRDNKMALIKEYAYPSDEWLWQFPEGLIDKDETVLEAGSRELLEEVGLIAGELTELGTNLSNHRRSIKRAHILYAPDPRDGVKAVGDVEEQGTEFHWLPITEVYDMLKDGRIIQGNAQSALAIYLVNFATKPVA